MECGPWSRAVSEQGVWPPASAVLHRVRGIESGSRAPNRKTHQDHHVLCLCAGLSVRMRTSNTASRFAVVCPLAQSHVVTLDDKGAVFLFRLPLGRTRGTLVHLGYRLWLSAAVAKETGMPGLVLVLSSLPEPWTPGTREEREREREWERESERGREGRVLKFLEVDAQGYTLVVRVWL